jgi:hypothetical protein
MPLPSWAGSTIVWTGTSARPGLSRTKYAMWPDDFVTGVRLQAAGRPVVADRDLAHGLSSRMRMRLRMLARRAGAGAEGGQAEAACGLRSWSEPGTGSDGSEPRATIRFPASTCTTRGLSDRASASETWA